jgi:simple sugar transport system substrate-binding protein
MRTWKHLAGFVLCAAVAALTVGCGDNGNTAGTTGNSKPSGTPDAGGKKKVVGFAQVGAESAWRTANSKSVQDEAAKRGYDLKFVSADQKPEKQVGDVRNFISQKVDLILVAPIVETGWESVLKEAKDENIPVVMSDRRANVPEDYYVTFIGSDFIEEGRRAGRWLAEKTGGKAVIFQLEGTMGSAPQIDRRKGFEEAIKDKPGMKVIRSQTGEFTRAKGKDAMEAFLNSPEGKDITAVFAHNDDMAMGAIQAIEAAGKKPGQDIVIVSIDGIKDAFQAIVDGKLNCTVECNPLLGPQLFDAIDKVLAGQGGTLQKRIPSEEGMYDQTGLAGATKVTKEIAEARKY